MLINYELLRTFLAAATASTFAEAAQRRRVTPSAISQQIRALEGQLGADLFERVGRRAQLTEAGTRLAAALRDRFSEIDEALALVVRDVDDLRGRVRLGAPRPFFARWIQPRLHPLLLAHPELELEVRFEVPTTLRRMLLAGAIDLAVLVEPFVEPALSAEVIYVEELMAVAAPEYLRKHGAPRTAAELGALRFIVFDDDLPMHAAWWRAAFGVKTALPAQIAARVASLDAMLAMASAGLGVTVLPGYFVAPALAAGEVCRLEVRVRQRVQNPIHLAWRTAALDTARRRAVGEALMAGTKTPRMVAAASEGADHR